MNGSHDNSAAERPVRVLVVDDEPLIVEMLTMGLNYEGFEVSIARTGFEAIEQARGKKPDLVILDIMLPGLDGIEVCRKLRAQSDVGILMLTALGEVEDRINGLDSGADDYLVKPYDLDEMLARVHAILRRADGTRAPERRFGALCISPSARTVTRNGLPVTLTPREWAILDRLSRRPGQTVPKAELEETVYGFGEEVESNAIEAHVSRLRAKLGRAAVETVRGFGYRMGQG